MLLRTFEMDPSAPRWAEDDQSPPWEFEARTDVAAYRGEVNLRATGQGRFELRLERVEVEPIDGDWKAAGRIPYGELLDRARACLVEFAASDDPNVWLRNRASWATDDRRAGRPADVASVVDSALLYLLLRAQDERSPVGRIARLMCRSESSVRERLRRAEAIGLLTASGADGVYRREGPQLRTLLELLGDQHAAVAVGTSHTLTVTCDGGGDYQLHLAGPDLRAAA